MATHGIGIGLIGCGWIAEIAHMPSLAALTAAGGQDHGADALGRDEPTTHAQDREAEAARMAAGVAPMVMPVVMPVAVPAGLPVQSPGAARGKTHGSLHPGARVVALADPRDARRAVALRRFPGAADYPDAAGLLADPAVTAVVLALPPGANRDVAVAAFAAGKDVYLEKPLAPDTQDGAAIVAAWRASGRIGMIGYNFRRSPAVEAARAAISAGSLGRILSVSGHFTWAAPEATGWRADPAQAGGVMGDLASHHVDLTAALCGSPVVAVSATIRSVRVPEDTADLVLRLADGTVAMLHASASSGRNANALRLMGTAGHLDVDLARGQPGAVISGSPAQGRIGRLREGLRRGWQGLRPGVVLAPGGEPSFRLAMAAFVDACTTRIPASPDPADGLAAVTVIEAARRSAARGGVFEPLGPS